MLWNPVITILEVVPANQAAAPVEIADGAFSAVNAYKSLADAEKGSKETAGATPSPQEQQNVQAHVLISLCEFLSNDKQVTIFSLSLEFQFS